MALPTLYTECDIKSLRFIPSIVNIPQKEINSFKAFIALYKEEIVGTVVAKSEERVGTEIIFIYVLPQFRHKGVGSGLLSQIETLNKVLEVRLRTLSKQYEVFASFFIKNDFFTKQYECSGVMFNRQSWEKEIKPMLNSDDIQCNVLQFNKLSNKQIQAINTTVSRYSLPHFLQPFHKNADINQIRLAFFEPNGELVGWCLGSFPTPTVFNLRCTYILPCYRNFRYSFYFWKVIAQLAIEKNDTVQTAIFHYDKKNIKLDCFYRRIFRSISANYFDQYIYQKP